ncbi:BRCA1 C Terminus (BRCT) domain [Nesidiocoris tenuis]|uniref:BRCA1 C Terminus (BRCT) domain n=1 Tax=Nesidiocoris tenuis TaxID=355587 RepID=A0ABN7B5Y0_9HEMI|nr:BRCA1 C Terminus (BRCT) domain [Nesidiocoris tenuis]
MAPTVKRRRKPRIGSPTTDSEKSPVGSVTRSSKRTREQPPRKKQKLDDVQASGSGNKPMSSPLSEIRNNNNNDGACDISRALGLLEQLRAKTPKTNCSAKTPKSARKHIFDESEANATPKKTPSALVEEVFFGNRADVDPFASAARYLPDWEKPEEPEGPLTYFSPPKPLPRTFTTPHDRLRMAKEAAEREGIPFVEPNRRSMELQAINLLMGRTSAAKCSTPFSNFPSPQSETSSLPSMRRVRGIEPSYSPFPAGTSTPADVPPMTPRNAPGDDSLLRLSGVKCLATPVTSTASPYEPADANSVKTNEEKQVFAGLTIYVEIKYLKMDKSKCIRDLVEKLGAKVVKTFAKSVNLVIFKEGKMSTYLRAKHENIPLVSVPWVDACRQLGSLVDPAKFPPSTEDEYKSEMFNAEMAQRDRFLKRGRLFLDRIKGLAPPSKSSKKKAATVGRKVPKEPKRPSGDKKVQKKLDFRPGGQNMGRTGDPDEEPPRRNSAPADLAISPGRQPIVDGVDVLRTPPKAGVSGQNRRKLFNPNESLAFSPSAIATPVDTSPYWKDSPSERPKSRTTSSKRPKRLDSGGKRTTASRKSLVPLMEQDEEANHSRGSLTCFDLGQRGGRLTRPQPRICFTSLRSQEQARYTEIVEELGAFEIDKSVTKKTTHLLSSVPPRRTVNLLRAIARGCWILDIDWLTFCKENDKWMSEEPFELKYFSDAVAKNRLERQAFGKNYSADIFADCGPIFVDVNVQPPQSDIVELLKLCKAAIAAESSASKIIISDRPVGEKYRNSKIPIVSPLWVLDSITHNKLGDLDSYKLT